MTRESHARIHERPAVRFRRPTSQSRLPGSVRGKAKWPSYSITIHGDVGFLCNRKNALRQLLVSQPVYPDRLRILDLIGDGI